MLVKSISFNSLALCAFAVFTAGTLAFIYANTKERILQQERNAAVKALVEIIPKDKHDNNMLDSTWSMRENDLKYLNLENENTINIAKKNDAIVGVIIPSLATDGYSGNIKMLIGINTKDNTIAGVRVVQHRETPGLGDKIDLNKSDWILSFNNKSLSDPEPPAWKVKKDGGAFDQFTGATITPRAVVNQVEKTLVFFENNKDIILQKNM